MSRIGKLPITIPANVTINISDENLVTVKGPLGELKQQVDPAIKLEIEGNILTASRPNDEKDNRSKHGLYRALIANMLIGVSEGFTTQQEFVGVGYKAELNGQVLDMSLGFSHSVLFELPKEIQAECINERRGNTILKMKSADKQLLGQVAAKIRSFRPPEPYKGKGIKFVNEELRRKAGKSAKV
ncbi:MAG: 50S ribosomal protein L6 [Bacteroidales bacterium]|jgi:large subunit ribosomal protein L6|nr:50S ribosomal protein L6 [Bacteroidales bacterium]MCK9498134.1 50S ribosomal protein L6 [Bacteroidales bacterium]MDY0313700.1 50S ribosomal protein L6 [Bacteroidales bacterium]NLB87545.1 50S ribosomal protein L6 [Bacteroidales bacterium]